MKIRAIEIEDGGKVTRYTGRMEVESSWGVPEGLTSTKQPEAVEVGARCQCGHLESEHLPECIYQVEGCECTGYAEEKAAKS